MAEDDRRRRMQMEFERARAEAEAQAAARGQKKNETSLPGLGKAGLTGVRTGSETLVGSPGDAPGMIGGGWSWLNRQLGATDEDAARRGKAMETAALATLDPRAKMEMLHRALSTLIGSGGEEPITEDLPRVFPTSKEVHQSVSSAYPDEATRNLTEHVPETGLERMVQTGGEMLPNLLFNPRSVVSSVIAPTLGAEAGGAIGKKAGYEDLGRFIGGVGGSAVPGAGTRMLTGPTLNDERARLAQLMGREGIDLTAGQVSGRKSLQYREVGPYDTKPGAIAEQQAEQFNRAATSRTGYPEANANPDTIRGMRDDFGVEYENIIRQTGGLPLDQQMAADLITLVDDFHRLKALPSNAPTQVNAYLQRISDAAQANGGVIPADVFQQLRSEISKSLRTIGPGDPALSNTLREFQDTLYGSIGRNAPPGVEQTWRDLNNRYRNFKVIEKSMMGAGEATAEGNITPQKLRGAVQQANPQDYVAGQGDFADLARGGEMFMKPLPQSGTTPRALSWGVPAAAAGSAFRDAMSGNIGTAAATVAGGALAPLIPAGISSLLTSDPVRNALVRRLTGEQGHFNPVGSALAARQLENEQGRR